MTSAKGLLDSRIIGYRVHKEGMFSKGTTYYTIETTSTLPGYERNRAYKVDRRFNDYKRLYQALTNTEQYKGFVIPPLPEETTSYASYFVHDDGFLKDR